MKKLWNHYDPLDFDLTEDADTPPQQVRPAPSARRNKRGALERLYDWLFRAEEEPGVQEPARAVAHAAPEDARLKWHREQVRQALHEWKSAAAYFEGVTDPELVDYAVYGMEAAQKRYIYLLRAAKGGGIQKEAGPRGSLAAYPPES